MQTYSFSVEGNVKNIQYSITGATLNSMTINDTAKSLLVYINSPQSGSMKIALPRDVIDSKHNNADVNYWIFLDGQDGYGSETDTTGQTRTLTIPFDEGTQVIEIVGTQLGTQQPPSVPSWIKNTAKFWAQGSVSDADFIKGIQYLIQQGIITVPPTQVSANPSQTIPSWVKNTANWWSAGQVSDADFIQSIQYLVQNGMIQVSTATGITTVPQPTNQPPKTFHNYGFSFNYPADWTVEDKTTNKNMPNVKIHSSDSSTVITMGLVSGEKAFEGLTGQVYLDTLVEYYKSSCNSNPTCSNFNLTGSQIIPFEGGSLYLVSFNSINTDNQGNKIMYTTADVDLPTPYGTWVMTAEGPSSNYASYSQQIEQIISSLTFDQASTSQQSSVTTIPQYQLYKNDQYGFSLEYPNEWNLVEHLGAAYTIKSVMVSPDNNLQFNFGVLRNNNPYAGITDTEILGDVTGMLRDGCSKATFQSRGFDCTSSQFFTNMSSYHGVPLYGVGMIWTKSFPNGTSLKWTSVWGVLPYGNDVWILAIESSADEFAKYQQEIGHMINSLNVYSISKTTPSSGQQTGTTQSTLTTDLTGQWEGTLSGTGTFDYYEQYTKPPIKVTCQASGPITFSLTQNGNDLEGDVDSTYMSLTGNPACPSTIPISGHISATVSGSSFSGTVSGIVLTGQFTNNSIQASLNGNVADVAIAGKVTAHRVG